MKKNVANILGLSMLMGGVGGIMPGMDAPYGKIRTKQPKIRTLCDFKHSGEIPKGCILEVQPLIFEKANYRISSEVELVYGTQKVRMKKLNKFIADISAFLNYQDIETIKKMDDFKVEELPVPEGTAATPVEDKMEVQGTEVRDELDAPTA